MARSRAVRSLLLVLATGYAGTLFAGRLWPGSNLRSRRRYKVQLVSPEGRTSEFDCPPDSTILDAAEEAGVEDLPYSCRAGACAACAGKISSGQVDQAGQAFLDQDQQRRGFCLTCVTYPTSDVVLHTHAEDQVLA